MSPSPAGHEHRPRLTSVRLQSNHVSKVEEKRRAVVLAREAALRHTGKLVYRFIFAPFSASKGGHHVR